MSCEEYSSSTERFKNILSDPVRVEFSGKVPKPKKEKE